MSRVVTESESQDKVILGGGKVKRSKSHHLYQSQIIPPDTWVCGDKILPYLWEHGEFCHTLIVSAPDVERPHFYEILSGRCPTDPSVFPGRTVGVVDERSEIAGCYQGIPQNNVVGIRTDVLDGCPKAE